MKNILFRIAVVICISYFFVASQVVAQTEEKVYSYDSIDTTIVVNPDSTFTVDEHQLYNYQSGTFHQGWRSIPLDDVSRITDITVIDGVTGQALRYSSRRLDKADPASWGSYTYYEQDGNLTIEWYYDLSNTKHAWELRYTVHGGFDFYADEDHDRLYWNIFSGYDVPVYKVTALVVFPRGVDLSQFTVDVYRSTKQPVDAYAYSTNEIDFEALAIAPQEALTIDITFPKGIVSESAFWKDWISGSYGYWGSALVILFGSLFLIAYWYWTERYKKGRGVIVAQYEPPQHLRPAMAEVLIKETITAKTWPATIVDLAVRGYVRVVEEDPGIGPVIGRAILSVLALTMLAGIEYAFWSVGVPVPILWILAVLVVALGWKFLGSGPKLKKWLFPKSYCVEKVKDYTDDPTLESYERKFLGILFSNKKDRFSLGKIRKNRVAQRVLAEALDELKQDLYKEVDSDTKAFAKRVSKGKYFGYISSGLFLLWAIMFRIGFLDTISQLQGLIFVVIAMATLIIGFILFEPRLSQEGHLLREDWLGFKLYLETAERYRLQNLTPDIFEKYLSYAMLFGIEKKWAKAFETITIQVPTWYAPAVVGSSAGSSSSQSFSPVTFSTSFASSFTNAFASSGGGGGGSAGGGGGGGGGGAS